MRKGKSRVVSQELGNQEPEPETPRTRNPGSRTWDPWNDYIIHILICLRGEKSLVLDGRFP